MVGKYRARTEVAVDSFDCFSTTEYGIFANVCLLSPTVISQSHTSQSCREYAYYSWQCTPLYKAMSSHTEISFQTAWR